MDNLISVKLQGGLGNYLFQIAAAFFISKRDKKKLILDIDDVEEGHSKINIFYDNIFRNLFFSKNLNIENLYYENKYSFNDIPYHEKSLKLIGYFQTEKYFKNFRKEIIDLFSIDNKSLEYINLKYRHLLVNKTCSIHIRRGDYLNKPLWHPLLGIDYYKKATSYFTEDTTFLIFSDDIDWCKNNFNFLKNFEFVENNLPYIDLYLMTLCQNNIIANSSFSWWGAWLNQNENKKIISPNKDKWFGILGFKDREDLIPKDWLEI